MITTIMVYLFGVLFLLGLLRVIYLLEEIANMVYSSIDAKVHFTVTNIKEKRNAD